MTKLAISRQVDARTLVLIKLCTHFDRKKPFKLDLDLIISV